MASLNFQPGLAFKEGKLYRYTQATITVMRGWPDPRAWHLDENGWKGYRPHLNLKSLSAEERRLRYTEDLPLGLVEKVEAITLFLDTIPKEVKWRVCRFNHRQWSLLSYARCPGALDLIDTNPALAYMIANSGHFRRASHPMRTARRLTRIKQRDALGWLGFPRTESTARILRKIPTQSIRLQGLKRLQKALYDPKTAQLIRHAPRLNAGALRMLDEPQLNGRLDYHLLNYVSQKRSEDRRAKTIWKLLRDPAYEQFPKPPFPAEDWIVPIRTRAQLAREGRTQKHCVEEHLESILEGHEYIYRVLDPQRATLSICAIEDRWEIRELRLAHNEPASRHTTQAIERWLTDHQGEPRDLRPYEPERSTAIEEDTSPWHFRESIPDSKNVRY